METLHFAGRAVPPYGEYAAETSLVEGNIYFKVDFLDKQMTIPELKPLVFVGRNLTKGRQDRLYFQDVGSYLAGVRFGQMDCGTAEFHEVKAGTPFVHEFERALDRLLYCSVSRGRA